MSKKINGYAKWIGIALAILAIIWNANTLYNEVRHINKNIEKIESRLEKIEDRLYERAK